ncbi:MAG: DUF1284 domain-containing protein [Eubacteriales bacterium]|nr:DUF1284 domain-containing protein [Eubacteriales bacterium]
MVISQFEYRKYMDEIQELRDQMTQLLITMELYHQTKPEEFDRWWYGSGDTQDGQKTGNAARYFSMKGRVEQIEAFLSRAQIVEQARPKMLRGGSARGRSDDSPVPASAPAASGGETAVGSSGSCIENSAQKPLRLRPHHLLCLQNFRGSGYSAAFIQKMEETVLRLSSNPSLPVLLVQGCDDLCEACPHNDRGRCTSTKVSVFDARVLQILYGDKDVICGEAFSLEELLRLLPVMSTGLLDACCGDCRWIGLCKNIVSP